MISYEDFRTGLTFSDVRELLSHEQDVAREQGQYMFVSRGTVLGRWCEIKRGMYAQYERHITQREGEMNEELNQPSSHQTKLD